VLYRGNAARPVKCPAGDGYQAEMAYFARCVRTGTPPEVVTAAQAAESIPDRRGRGQERARRAHGAGVTRRGPEAANPRRHRGRHPPPGAGARRRFRRSGPAAVQAFGPGTGGTSAGIATSPFSKSRAVGTQVRL
jgi:hypothetical protein